MLRLKPQRQSMSTQLALLFGFVMVVAQATVADEPQPKSREDSITVTVVGTLRTDRVAIGGETTGTAIQSKGITWELDFGRNSKLSKAVEKLDGKQVIVEGSLERRQGVEIKDRWIVSVTKLLDARD